MRALAAGLGYLVLTVALVAPGGASAEPDPRAGEKRWPQRVVPPAGAPNVLIWMQDDAGFAHSRAYGGLVDTPTIDRLAAGGLRYTNFHTTALCSATRASLLTGRNSHAVGVGSHAAATAAYPGYDSRIPRSAATIARVLQTHGYATYALGKWDHLPSEHVTTSGPYTYWPTGQGFDRFYGFLAADADNFRPVMWLDQAPVDPARGRDDYHLSADLADRAIDWISELQSVTPERPFFMYWATGAVHAPHHAPRAYIEKYRGRFDMGWDEARRIILAQQKKLGIVPGSAKLPPRPEFIAAWNSLGADQKKLYARAMEVFAAQLTHADHEFGRIVDTLARLGELENTIILITSDNGASGEGSPTGTYSEYRFMNAMTTPDAINQRYMEKWGGPGTYPHYPIGWAMAGNTPFKFWKQTNHEGGTRDLLVAHWPKGIRDAGALRTQFHHINDISPTLMAAIGIEPPGEVDGVAQQPIDGVSMTYSFDQPAAPTAKQVQYFEMFGNRAIWAGGWKAVLLHNPRAWEITAPRRDVSWEGWELYDLATDFNELHDLATRRPEKLAEMVALFDAEARRNHVYPIMPDAREYAAKLIADRMASNGGRYVYTREGGQRIPERAAPPILNRGHTIGADIDVPVQGTDGAIVAQGGNMGGWALHVAGGRLTYSYNYFGDELFQVRASAPLAPGRRHVEAKYVKTGDTAGEVALSVDGTEVARGPIPRVNPMAFSLTETLDVGTDWAAPVVADYAARPEFTGGIDRVTIEVAR
ncbi:MAG: arylsulfatase [Gammaproteobacteria bacterium]